MTKIVKTDHTIVPATSLAGKVEEALANRSSLKVDEYPGDDWIGWSSWGARPRPTREEWAAAWARWADAHDPNDSSDANWSFTYLIATYAPIAWWGYFYPEEPLALRDVAGGVEVCVCGHVRKAHSVKSSDELREGKPSVSCLATVFDTLRQCNCAGYIPQPPSPYSREDWAAALGEARVDAVGPGIALTVEPLNPVLRAEGSREIAVDTETRLFDPGYPDEKERRVLTRELDPGSDLKIKIPAFADRVSVGPANIVLYFQDDENTILYSIDAAQNGDSIPIASAATQITVRNYGNRKLSAKLTFRMAL